jgi:Thermolysin metallopeptidase, catalytic domain
MPAPNTYRSAGLPKLRPSRPLAVDESLGLLEVQLKRWAMHVIDQRQRLPRNRRLPCCVRCVRGLRRVRRRRSIMDSGRTSDQPRRCCGGNNQPSTGGDHLKDATPYGQQRRVARQITRDLGGQARGLVADEAVNEAYYGSGATYEFYQEVCGRDSVDGAGMELVSSVHYGVGLASHNAIRRAASGRWAR